MLSHNAYSTSGTSFDLTSTTYPIVPTAITAIGVLDDTIEERGEDRGGVRPNDKKYIYFHLEVNDSVPLRSSPSFYFVSLLLKLTNNHGTI